MEIGRHVVTKDTGLAPNPFHGYCTSAVCTPSHCNARVGPGDWLIGHTGAGDGYKLVYAMLLSENRTMDQYFADKRFQQKKPNLRGTFAERCGYNVDCRDTNGQWQGLPSLHNQSGDIEKDTRQGRGAPVFIATRFFFFGRKRIRFNREFPELIKHGQGIEYTDGEVAQKFVAWLEANHKPGIIGLPEDVASFETCSNSVSTLEDLEQFLWHILS